MITGIRPDSPGCPEIVMTILHQHNNVFIFAELKHGKEGHNMNGVLREPVKRRNKRNLYPIQKFRHNQGTLLFHCKGRIRGMARHGWEHGGKIEKADENLQIMRMNTSQCPTHIKKELRSPEKD
jgi:hypothetical protein